MMCEYTLTIRQANLYGLILFLPILVLTATPYFWLNGFNLPKPSLGISLLFLFLMVAGIVIHELLHGVVWAAGQKQGWKAIQFGFNKEWLTPYCHCSQPVSVMVYRMGAVAPLIVLGIIPLGVSYWNGNFNMWLYGAVFTIAAAGDIIAIWMIRKLKWNSQVMDHPEKMGFIQIEKD